MFKYNLKMILFILLIMMNTNCAKKGNTTQTPKKIRIYLHSGMGGSSELLTIKNHITTIFSNAGVSVEFVAGPFAAEYIKGNEFNIYNGEMIVGNWPADAVGGHKKIRVSRAAIEVNFNSNPAVIYILIADAAAHEIGHHFKHHLLGQDFEHEDSTDDVMHKYMNNMVPNAEEGQLQSFNSEDANTIKSAIKP